MTRWHHLGSVFLITAVACGGGSSSSGSDARGSNHDGGSLDGAPRTDITVTSGGDTPDVYEYKDGSGDWQAVDAPNGSGQSTIHVTNDYLLLALCAGTGSDFDGIMRAAVAADGDQSISCFDFDATNTQPTEVTVTGTMKQPGNIQFGSSALTASGNTTPWAYDLPTVAASATYDIAGFDKANTQMLLHRGVVVGTAAVTVPLLDLTVTSEAGALQKPALAFTNLGSGAEVIVDTTLITANGGDFDLGGTSSAAILAPDAILTADDSELVDIDASTPTGEQDVHAVGSTGFALPATLAMLSEPTGITFATGTATTAVRASWTTPPTTTGTISVTTIGGMGQEQIISATPGWITATAATSLAFDTTATGYKAIWEIDPAAFFAELSIDQLDTSTGVDFAASTFDAMSTEPLRKAGATRHQRHVRRVRR